MNIIGLRVRREYLMAKIGESVAVRVEDKGLEGEMRRYLIEIEAKDRQFVLSNILAKEGAIPPLIKRLKRSCQLEVVGYIKDGKKTLKDLKHKETRTAPEA